MFAVVLSSLTGTPYREVAIDAPNAKGVLRWKERTVKLDVSGLPQLPADKVYQLWHIGPVPAPIPRRTFSTTGTLVGADTVVHDIVKGHAFAVTIEPKGGSKAPTMPILFVAAIP